MIATTTLLKQHRALCPSPAFSVHQKFIPSSRKISPMPPDSFNSAWENLPQPFLLALLLFDLVVSIEPPQAFQAGLEPLVLLASAPEPCTYRCVAQMCSTRSKSHQGDLAGLLCFRHCQASPSWPTFPVHFSGSLSRQQSRFFLWHCVSDQRGLGRVVVFLNWAFKSIHLSKCVGLEVFRL